MPCATRSQWTESFGIVTSGAPLTFEELSPNSPLELRTELGSLNVLKLKSRQHSPLDIFVINKGSSGVIQWDILSMGDIKLMILC